VNPQNQASVLFCADPVLPPAGRPMAALSPVPRAITPSSAGAMVCAISGEMASVCACACWCTTAPSGPMIFVT
jgi:hypothetical protein